jgi:hypothetical protein
MRSKHEEQLAKARASIEKIRSAIGDLDQGLCPQQDALAKLDEWLDTQVASLNRWPVHVADFTHPANKASGVSGLDESGAAGLFVQVMRDQIRAHFAAKIADQYAGKVAIALSTNERAKRQAELESDLYEAELAEERIIVDAERAGFYFARRSNVNPQVLVAVL